MDVLYQLIQKRATNEILIRLQVLNCCGKTKAIVHKIVTEHQLKPFWIRNFALFCW